MARGENQAKGLKPTYLFPDHISQASTWTSPATTGQTCPGGATTQATAKCHHPASRSGGGGDGEHQEIPCGEHHQPHHHGPHDPGECRLCLRVPDRGGVQHQREAEAAHQWDPACTNSVCNVPSLPCQEKA